jgi:hypothetical protein
MQYLPNFADTYSSIKNKIIKTTINFKEAFTPKNHTLCIFKIANSPVEYIA